MTRDQIERLNSFHEKLLILATQLDTIAGELRANGFAKHAETLSGLRQGLLEDAPVVRRLTDTSRN